jgi:dTDP-glucose 4,6-dehydratase
MPIYGDGLHMREWLYVKDHCQALLAVWERGQPGQIYNIGSGIHHNNLAILDMIIKIVSERYNIYPDELYPLFRHTDDRHGHDRRYALDCTRLHQQIKFITPTKLQEGLTYTINWYLDHPDWWEGDNDQEWWLRR